MLLTVRDSAMTIASSFILTTCHGYQGYDAIIMTMYVSQKIAVIVSQQSY